ncbi:MAG: archaetidylserine decarboxylase [Woeseiaceae bacterium]|nr:archaetidylserine decarboxylase [Woeseiaceae bacterium]
MLARALARLQYLLPRYGLTALVYRIARIRQRGFKDFLIRRFIRLYAVDTADVADGIPDDFPTFNDFFTRALKDGARPVDTAADSIVSPCDGTLSQAGAIDGSAILQAKGFTYTPDELLAIDLDTARRFHDGSFATIYLAPYDYHRVHAPLGGRLVAAHYVPGDLFSVNTTTASIIPGLFRRNERLVLHLETAYGPAAIVMVGALNVGSITTPWTGEIRPRQRGLAQALDLDAASVDVDKGALLGWFNMGSTVILLLPPGACSWHEELATGTSLRMGEAIGRLAKPGP